jgi:hypothetical protein
MKEKTEKENQKKKIEVVASAKERHQSIGT